MIATVGILLGANVLAVGPAFAGGHSGNNGTIKIHEQGTPSGTESNDPKVCVFNVEGFSFDAGQTGYLVFDVQGGDKPTGTSAGPYAWGPTNSDGFYASEYFNLAPGHYKATLYGKYGDGGINYKDVKAKSKVFKVVCSQTVPVPAKPAQNDPCGPNNATWVVPQDTDKVDWTLRSDGHVIAATKAGYKFDDGTTSHDYGVAVDSGTPCPGNPPVAIPTQDTTDPCNGPGVTNNVAWSGPLPADTAEIDWSQSNNGATRTATLKGDRKWSDGTTASKVFNLPADSGVKCDNGNPPCITKPATYTVSGTMIMVTGAKPGTWLALYEANDPMNQTLLQSVLVGQDCTATVVLPPKQCESQQLQWDHVSVQPAQTLTVDHGGDGIADVDGFIAGALFTVPGDESLCEVTTYAPPRVKSHDECEPQHGTNDTFTVPSSANFTYVKNGTPMDAGTYKARVTRYVIKAVPNDGVSVTEGAKTRWVLKFSKNACFVPKDVRGAVKMVDKCRTSGDMYAVKPSRGIVYFADGQRVRENVWLKTHGDRKIIVRARPASDQFNLIGKVRWVLRFDNRPCGTPSQPPDTGI
jgi:hypothetical protein